LSLKEGSPYEELALIRALHQLITTTNNATGLLPNAASYSEGSHFSSGDWQF